MKTSICKVCNRALKKGDVGHVCKGKIKDAKDLEQSRREQSLTYDYSRESSVPNLGEDFKSAMRFKIGKHMRLADIEKLTNEQANQCVKRNNIIKANPLDINIKEGEAYKVFAYDQILKSLPVTHDQLKKGGHSLPAFAVVRKKTRDGEEHLTLFYIAVREKFAQEQANRMNSMKSDKECVFEVLQLDTQEEIDKLARESSFDQFHFVKKIIEEDSLINRDGTGRENATAIMKEAFDKYREEYSVDIKNSRAWVPNNDVSFLNKLSKHKRDLSWNICTVSKYGVDLNDIDHLVKEQDIIGTIKLKEPRALSEEEKAKRVAAFNPIVFYANQTIERVGTDIKSSTIDEHINDLENKWKFRGVQNGETVTDKERLEHYSQINMAFNDLSEILGVKNPDTLSFNGKLGVAIGSMGGSKNALATYRAGEEIISFTRKKGIGALAHEWGHALDDYYSKRKGMGGLGHHNRSSSNTVSESGNKFAEKVENFRAKMRSSEEFKKYPNKHKKYLYQPDEVFARVFEAMVKHKLEKSGKKNTYLVSHGDSACYPTVEELSDMEKDFDIVVKEMIGEEK